MLVKTYASAVQGVDARTITVEVNTGGAVGFDAKQYFHLVGLPDSAIREGMMRMEPALKNSGYDIIRLKTIVNLGY